jgi:hypothetical protein
MNGLGLSCHPRESRGPEMPAHGEGNDPYLGFRGEDENDMVRVSR